MQLGSVTRVDSALVNCHKFELCLVSGQTCVRLHRRHVRPYTCMSAYKTQPEFMTIKPLVNILMEEDVNIYGVCTVGGTLTE